MTSRALHLWRVAALAAAMVLTVATAACGADADDDLPPPASPETTASNPASAADPEQQQVLDIYYASVDATVAAQQAGDPEYPDLARYFLERAQALNDIQATIARNDSQELYYTGELVVTAAEVTEIDRDATPPIATITACVDYANYRLVSREDDAPVPGAEPLSRHPATSQAVLGTDDRWYIATSTADWDVTC